jgi:hypothetical protein
VRKECFDIFLRHAFCNDSQAFFMPQREVRDKDSGDAADHEQWDKNGFRHIVTLLCWWSN